MFDYANEWSALNDVLRLSRGMTFKAAITGLNIGGGKAVIMGDANAKTPELMRKVCTFIKRKIHNCRRCRNGNQRYGHC
jgi:leucine dehydrogenase